MIEQGSGHIAVTSSVAGKVGVPFRTGYCAAKHAMMGFFDALRSEVTQHNIKVSTITPGYIKTNVSKNAVTGDGSTFGKTDISIENGMQVDACAKVIFKGLQKAKKEIVVGKGLEMIILKLKRFFPNLVFKIMESQYKKIAASNRLE
jgi:short-subunit dehydrogenase